jgi:IPT/TIG domain
MTKTTHRGVLLLGFAIGLAACDGRSPAGPTPLSPAAPPSAPGPPSVTAISPSTGSTARPTSILITGTGFLAGATVTVDIMAVSVIVVNSTTITAIAPPHAAGSADVVVTNPGGSGGTLPAAFIYAFEEPVTVTPSTNAVDAGGQMSVSWTAPGARAGDWLALFRVGASYEDDWWGHTHGATAGTHTLTAPTRPGRYEFRYLMGDGFLEAARSSPVMVR